jgi:hypothetical protein
LMAKHWWDRNAALHFWRGVSVFERWISVTLGVLTKPFI